jgi:hypothetical protein
MALIILAGPPKGPSSASAAKAFDGRRAFAHLQAQCDFGPRVPGTKPHEQARDYLKRELARWADRVEEQHFTAELGGRSVEMTNLFAFISPAECVSNPQAGVCPAPKWVIVCAHWDTRPTADREKNPALRARPIPGANDGASGTAVVLELARVLAEQRPHNGVILVLFDGEDYGPAAEQMLLGSGYFAKNYRGPRPDWGVLVDMVGDRDLEIPVEGYSWKHAPEVVERIWRAAESVGSRAFMRRNAPPIADDHLPLLKAGIPCIAVIDFDYPYWHTLADTPDKCSPQSLQAVGDVLVAALMQE